MALGNPEEIQKPILATLLLGVLPGAPSLGVALAEFRQALSSSSAGAAEAAQVDQALGVFGVACAFFSDPQRALDWLTSPSEVFGGKSPLAMLPEAGGRSAVPAQLTRIQHGIFY
jgi:uncharacterized protein (DUF2384 family)